MNIEFQLETWLRGVPLHDYELGRCVPDMSCCRKELLAPFEERVLFIESLSNRRMDICEGMLLIFGSRAFPGVPIGGFYNA
jgi:hypothetical protein